MAWTRSPDELIEHFGRVVEGFEGVERRKMFGYPAAFVGGNLVTSLHQANWIVRLPDDARDEAMAEGATQFEPMIGRPMRGYVALPASVLADAERLRSWVSRAVEHGRTLPAKK
jgi:TfoX/Sxy family transcriptional regulator of competence genes